MANLNMNLSRLNTDVDWLIKRVKRLWKVKNAGKAVELFENLERELYLLKTHWFKRLEDYEQRLKRIEENGSRDSATTE